MPSTALALPASPRPRLGLLQLVLRSAAGQAAEELALLFGLALERLQARLAPAHVQGLIAGLRGLAARALPERRQRLLLEARQELAIAQAAGRPGAVRYVQLMTARGQDAAWHIAASAWRLVGRVDRMPEGLSAPRRPHVTEQGTPPASPRPMTAADRQAHRFARALRNELIAAEGLAAPAEPVATAPLPPPAPTKFSGPVTPELLAYEQADPQPLPRNVFELERYRGQIDHENPPWLSDDWQFVLGHHSGPDEPPWDPEEEAEREAAGPPPEPEPPRSPEQIAIDFAYLDRAIYFRLSRMPPPNELQDQRNKLKKLVGNRWPDHAALGRAIREGLWWPPPPPFMSHMPWHETSIPARFRYELPP
jgi:hypothetical protein